jgi:aldehyde:ferredoxin oxidoreductase
MGTGIGKEKMEKIQAPYQYDAGTQSTPFGYTGRILHVDLTSKQIWMDENGEMFYRTLVGGRGVIAYYLLKETSRFINPLSPDNLLIFAPGVLTGTSLPGTGRHGIGGKSPLTGAIASAEAGGWWGAELKRAGLDGLVIHGRSLTPVYISILDGEVSILDASHLWGKSTGETQGTIRMELNDDKVRVACIGIAGENQVLFASIQHDVNRAAGRAGLGAVMGSKNLKAIAVRGKTPVKLANKGMVLEVSKWLAENYRVLSRWRIDMGTPATVMILSKLGALPTRNFQEPVFEGAEDISGERMHATVLKDRDTCNVCPIRCKQVVEINNGKYQVDPIYGGPEFETMAAFGSNCGISDLASICKANELCNAYGLDTISTGGTIAFVMECFQKGLLTEADTDGFRLEFGNAAAMLQAVEMIAHRVGFGQKMALGSARLANEIGRGAEDLVVAVKKLESAYHDPRLKPLIGLGYSVAPVGADHMMNVHDTNYLENGAGLVRIKPLGLTGPQPLRSLEDKKVEIFYYEVSWQHFQDCAVTCMFFPYQYQHLTDALNGATGWQLTIRDILRVGERANTLSRIYNIREGIGAEQDRLPKRFFEPYKSGPLNGVAPAFEQMENARHKYYELMGWDALTGIPTQERVTSLDLNFPWMMSSDKSH